MHNHETPPALTPCNPPLGPQPSNPKFYSPVQTVLVMKEKILSLSGDDFTIKTADGTDVLKCKGKVFSIHDKTKFTDMQGEEVFTLSKKMISLYKSFHGESPNGHDFEISGHFKLVGSKSSVRFKNAADSQDVELEVRGDWLDRKAEIKMGDRVVASISRHFFNAAQFFGDKQTYFVAVAPNVDLSLVAAICVAVDERERDDDE